MSWDSRTVERAVPLPCAKVNQWPATVFESGQPITEIFLRARGGGVDGPA